MFVRTGWRERLKFNFGIFAFIFAASLGSASASAHHAASMFDHSQKMTLTGTVMKFEFANPHSSLVIATTDDNNKTIMWDFEAESPSMLMRMGINGSTFRPGDEVIVVANPGKDNHTKGALLSVTKVLAGSIGAHP
jgi:hypothetical protein